MFTEKVILIYHVAEFEGGQDKRNSVFWLTTWTGMMGLYNIMRLGFSSLVQQGNVLYLAVYVVLKSY